MWTYNYENSPDLYHHGIKGMKWGVRRYQNKDGSLTPAGKKHSTNKERRSEVLEKLSSQSIKGGKDKPNISPAEKIAKESGSVFDNASKAYGTISSARSQKNSKVKTMSDQELKDAIARMDLEKRYSTLSAETTSRGKSYVTDVLSVAGSVAAIGASVAAIASTINALRK